MDVDDDETTASLGVLITHIKYKIYISSKKNLRLNPYYILLYSYVSVSTFYTLVRFRIRVITCLKNKRKIGKILYYRGNR